MTMLLRIAALAGALLLAALPEAHAVDLRGRVLDAAGAPIPGAEVSIWSLDETGEIREPAHAVVRANAAGRFVLPDAPGAVMLCAAAPGYAPTVAYVLPKAQPITLRLRAPRAITGKVFLPDGTPAAGLVVCPAQTESDIETIREYGHVLTHPTRIPRPVAERLSARTGADGAFRMETPPSGKLRLRIADPRFVTEVVEVADGPANVRLRPGCRVRGHVRDGAAALAGWTVRVMPIGRFSSGVHRGATTGADGSFLLSGLAPGSYFVFARPPAGAGKTAPVTEVYVTEAQPDAEVTFAAVDGGFIAGRVADAETKAPLPGVRVWVRGADVPQAWGSSREATTGADGRFRFRVPAGPAEVRLTAPEGYVRDWKPEEVQVREGEETPVEILLQPGLTLSGHVLDAAGKPAAGAKVRAVWRDGSGQVMGTADAEGRFRLRGLPDGEFTLKAIRGEETLAIPLTLKPPFPSDLRVEIGPPPQVTLTGRVVDDEGKPAGALPVCLQATGPGRNWAEEVDTTTTGKDGSYRFEVRDLNARYSVVIASHDYRLRGGGEWVGDAGSVRRFTDLVVGAFGHATSGRVVDARQRPVAGAVVFWPTGTPRHRVVTGADGRFRIEGLPNRPITLMAHDAGRGAGVVRVAPGQEAVLTITPAE